MISSIYYNLPSTSLPSVPQPWHVYVYEKLWEEAIVGMISKLVASIGIAEFVASVCCYSDCDCVAVFVGIRFINMVFVCVTSTLGFVTCWVWAQSPAQTCDRIYCKDVRRLWCLKAGWLQR